LKGFIEHHRALRDYVTRHIDSLNHDAKSWISLQSIQECCDVPYAAKMYVLVKQKGANLAPQLADEDYISLESQGQTPWGRRASSYGRIQEDWRRECKFEDFE
jgi:hypothetical protein